MKAYAAILSARCRTLLQYRAAALAGLACQLFWGVLRVAIFSAFYGYSVHSAPMTLPEVVTYVWLGQAFLRMIPWIQDGEVRDMVRSGTIVYELTRPLDLYALWYTRSIAALTAPVLLRGLPLLVLATCALGLQAPASWASGLAWVLSTLCAVLLGAAMQTLLTISMLWTVAGDGMARLAQVGIWIFSGIILPLPLFPDWFQPVLAALPFRGLMDTPFRLYMGHIPVEEALPLLGHQLAWAMVLVLLGRAVLARGTRRLVTQGG